ncbi:hypothetical protein TrRE_jg10154 [Triparma retinervis]|uniref:Uncharacterized protein n=1 Tax=Triparma retinervis TaxID=2557542 RepID=A0A9W7E434_9STRA|nr:hypothetical protein TrRE_jg10154 [Triparma retinervis]
MNKLTANKRTNLLEKSFGALKKARADKIKAMTLVRRWIIVGTQGSVSWAFRSWKAKVDAAEAFSSRSAFLAAADAEVRAQLAFTLNRFWMKKDVGEFGLDARADKRRGFLRWKHAMIRERERERVWAGVELRTSITSNILSTVSSMDVGDHEDNFTNNDAIYKLVNKYVVDMCNSNALGDEEEKKFDSDEDHVIRGSLVICDEDDQYILLNAGGLVKVPRDAGVLGGLMGNGTFGVSKQVLSDPRYVDSVDDVVLSSAGRPIFAMEREAARRFQTLAMKTSNVMSRTTQMKSSSGRMRAPGDRSGSIVVGIGEIGLGNMSAVSSTNVKIPDVAMMLMPIRVGEGTMVGAIVGVGRSELLGEETARNLGMLATAVAGGWLSLYR